MPIYEFYCPDCHTIFSFLSRGVDTEKRPACPRCDRPRLDRRPSAFAISKGRKEEPGGTGQDGLDEDRLEKAMASLAQEAEGLDDDPRQAARMMRKLYDAAGLSFGPGMAEALQRMEAGENPEEIEADLGEVLDEDPFGGGIEKKIERIRRRFAPPSVDSHLYEM